MSGYRKSTAKLPLAANLMSTVVASAQVEFLACMISNTIESVERLLGCETNVIG
jgi:hypothetical protein